MRPGDAERKTVRVFHQRESEAEALLGMLRKEGYRVMYDPTPGTKTVREIKEDGTSVIVIDLSRLPSHGRNIGAWVRGSKGIRHIPLVFVGGDPAKVAAIRREIPDAAYTSADRLPVTLRSLKSLREP